MAKKKRVYSWAQKQAQVNFLLHGMVAQLHTLARSQVNPAQSEMYKAADHVIQAIAFIKESST